MKQEFRDIYHILNIPQWEILQEHLASISNMAIITIDYKGVPVTRHSRCRSFCQSVRDDPYLSKLCQTCDSRGGLEAVRARKPYIYLCHFNIVDLAVPITVDDKYIGAIMAGQIRLSDNGDDLLEQVLTSRKNYVANQHLSAHYQEYLEIPKMPLEEIDKFAQMLFALYNYIARVVTEVNIQSQLNSDIVKKWTADYGESFSLNRPGAHASSAVLEPALALLANGVYNRRQKEMADLCHISTSYFSRLFIRETNQNYSQYITRAKIDCAKKMLEQTAFSAAQISDSLEFSSPCYFTKAFKKTEGITPNAYRKYFRDVDAIMVKGLDAESAETQADDAEQPIKSAL